MELVTSSINYFIYIFYKLQITTMFYRRKTFVHLLYIVGVSKKMNVMYKFLLWNIKDLWVKVTSDLGHEIYNSKIPFKIIYSCTLKDLSEGSKFCDL